MCLRMRLENDGVKYRGFTIGDVGSVSHLVRLIRTLTEPYEQQHTCSLEL